MDQKWVLKSKTIFGAILMAVPIICSLLGVEPPSADQLAAANVDFSQLMIGLSGLVGFGLTIYGRFTARTQLTVTGVKPDSTTLKAIAMLFMVGMAISLTACAGAMTKVDDTLANDDVQTGLMFACAVYHGVEAGWDVYAADKDDISQDALKAVSAAKAAVGTICTAPYPTSTNTLVAKVVEAGLAVAKALKQAQAPPAPMAASLVAGG